MNASRHERDLLIRYLLGYLQEEEREVVTSRFFSDELFAEALEDAERDLLDAYARGDLNAKDRAAVASRLLTSERQQEKLAVARALANRPAPVKEKRTLYRVLPWAAALILICGAAAVWRLRNEAPGPGITGTAVSPPKAKPATASPAIFAALLTAGGLRDGGVQEVKLPPGAELVRLDLQLETDNAAGRYGVRMTRDRQVILHQENLPAHNEAGLAILSVEVRAAELAAGRYSFSVTEGNASNASTFYHFQIR